MKVTKVKQAKATFFKTVDGGKVDSKAGIIYGVSIITVGPCVGHCYYPDDGPPIPMVADETTLAQVRDCIAAFGEDGVKVKTDHWGGFNDIVAAVRNPRIEGTQLRGDLYLLQESDDYAQILEMAEEMPSQFGLSISFSNVPEIVIVKTDVGTETTVAVARCIEIYSVDLVDQPAANPSGLFSRVDSKSIDEMDIKEIFTSFLGRETTLQTDLAAVRTEATNLKSQIAQKDSDLAAVNTSLNSAKAEITKKDEAIAAATKAHAEALTAKDAEVEKKASDRLLELCAQLGVKAPVTLPKDAPKADAIAELRTKLSSEPDMKERFRITQKLAELIGKKTK